MTNLVLNIHNVEIKGWIGTYTSTRGRKVELTDFPDNFISLYANQKMGEFNILPVVGQNKLNEVYVVGQLHVDIFELTELPDMALSNRQGYKTDDPRYQAVLVDQIINNWLHFTKRLLVKFHRAYKSNDRLLDLHLLHQNIYKFCLQVPALY